MSEHRIQIFLRRLRWIAYRRLPRAFGRLAARLRPKFADVEGVNVQWFSLNCVERREGGGHVAVGDNCRIEGTLICHRSASRIIIGSRTSIGGAAVVESLNKVLIGDDCLIAHHVTIQDHNSHPLEWRHRQDDVLNWIAGTKDWTHVQQADVVIENRCWIGTRVIILKGVHLGEGTIIGAGSVVTKSFPPYSIVAGNPARLIRSQVEPDTADRTIPA